MNISLDTLRPGEVRPDDPAGRVVQVLDGIEAAKEAGFSPVKINGVVERGVNDDEVVDLAALGREKSVEVRFIEYMPLDADGGFGPEERSSARTRSSPRSRPSTRSSGCRPGGPHRLTGGASSTAGAPSA